MPLSHIRYFDFIELVVYNGVRPGRPDNEDAPHLSDPIWEIVTQCWVKDARERPTASFVSDGISQMLEASVDDQVVAASQVFYLQAPNLNVPVSRLSVNPDPSIAAIISVSDSVPDRTMQTPSESSSPQAKLLAPLSVASPRNVDHLTPRANTNKLTSRGWYSSLSKPTVAGAIVAFDSVFNQAGGISSESSASTTQLLSRLADSIPHNDVGLRSTATQKRGLIDRLTFRPDQAAQTYLKPSSFP